MKYFSALAIRNANHPSGQMMENLISAEGRNDNPTRETECIASRTYDPGRIQLIKEQPEPHEIFHPVDYLSP